MKTGEGSEMLPCLPLPEGTEWRESCFLAEQRHHRPLSGAENINMSRSNGTAGRGHGGWYSQTAPWCFQSRAPPAAVRECDC